MSCHGFARLYLTGATFAFSIFSSSLFLKCEIFGKGFFALVKTVLSDL